MKINNELLNYALAGLQLEKAALNQKIYELEASLAGKRYILPTGQPACPAHATDYDMDCDDCRDITGQNPKKAVKQRRKSHTMSAAGRKAVSDAQKARWRKIRREKKLQGLKKSGK